MLGRLLLLFTVVPMVELYLLLWVSRSIGFAPTVAIVLATGLLGAVLAKAEGLRVYRKWQAALAQGRIPEDGVLGGVLVLVGGVLLVTPGVLTDLIGLALLFPPTRRAIAALVRRRLERSIAKGTVRVVSFSSFGGPLDPTIPRERSGRDAAIEVEGEVIDDRDSPEGRLRLPDRTSRSGGSGDA